MHWDGVAELSAICSRPLSLEEARRFWIASPWVRRFERGQCSRAEFAAGVVGELSLPVSPERFLEEFSRWDRGPLPGSLDLLDALAGSVRLACLSNNNEIHWARLRVDFAHRFERCYISHELGMIKPDADIFAHVVSDLGCPADRILFLDDNPECVAGAEECGLRAVQVRGVAEARAAISQRGLLGAS